MALILEICVGNIDGLGFNNPRFSLYKAHVCLVDWSSDHTLTIILLPDLDLPDSHVCEHRRVEIFFVHWQAHLTTSVPFQYYPSHRLGFFNNNKGRFVFTFRNDVNASDENSNVNCNLGRGAVGGEQNRGNSYDEPPSPFGTGSRLTSNNNAPQDGSVNRNPFTGGILGLTRSGSASTTSSAASHTRHGNKNAGQASTVGGRPRPGSINKNSISLPVPVPSPTRKPPVYTDDPFGDKLGLSPITERTSIAPSSVNFAGIGTTAPPSVTSSNWAQRQHLVPPHSPAPSTPSMYPPTLPADDEMDDTGEFDSDATMEKGGRPKQSGSGSAMAPPSAYNDVTGYKAFQNLFVVPSRPKAPAPAPPPMPQLPPVSRVPPQPLKINTNTNAPDNRERTTSLTAPPRPPRSILRTSANGSLSALSSPTAPQAKRQGSTEFIPLTPPASTPNHSPNPTYTIPGSIGRSGSWSKTNLNGGQARSLSSVGQPQQQASPPLSPVVVQEKVQEMLANRRLLLDADSSTLICIHIHISSFFATRVAHPVFLVYGHSFLFPTIHGRSYLFSTIRPNSSAVLYSNGVDHVVDSPAHLKHHRGSTALLVLQFYSPAFLQFQL
ncbi:hypothetical protein H1R20_g5971, partial [Candolleomyces eurysporus]